MTVPTENATSPKSTKSRDSNSLVQIQIQSDSQFEFASRDPEKLEFVDLVGVGVQQLQLKLSYACPMCDWGMSHV